MASKRNFDEGGDEGSEFPPREPKRHHAFAGIFRDVIKEHSLQEFVHKLEPLFRNWVHEEVERVISSYLRCRSLHDNNGSSGSRSWRLHFEDEIPPTLFTGSNIETKDNRPIKIVLRDATSKEIIAIGPLSSVKVKIVPLDGDFNPDDRGDWTEEEFNNKIIREREAKRPLLTGNLVVQLRDGVGYIGDICFTDNSSWIRGRKFRLGAKVHTVSAEVKIREGVSKEFKVKDHRGQSYKKHYPPSMDDEVWRLEKIAKDGVSHKRLTQQGITTVREFLWLYMTNQSLLRKILNDGVFSEKKWKTITDHANSCVLDDNELYMYRAAEGFGVIVNSIFKAVGAILGGEYHQSLDKLDVFQKQMVENLKQQAYTNKGHLIPVDSQSLIGFSGCPVLLKSFQANSFSSLVEQDQVELQMNSDHATISPSYTCQVEENNQFETSVAESSHRMQKLSSTFRNSFSLTDAICGLNSRGYSWYPTDSTAPLVSSNTLALNENFSFAESAMQANGLFTAPINEGTQIVSSDFGIRISGNRKPRVRWCKLRAIVKWQILVRQKWLLNQWQNFCV